MKNEKDNSKMIKSTEKRVSKSFNKADELCNRLKAEYQKALNKIEKDVADFYMRYATKNGISYATATQYLSSIDLQRYRRTLKDYENLIDTKDAALMAQLDFLYANTKVTRLENLMTDIRVELTKLEAFQTGGLREHLTDIFKESYIGAAAGIEGLVEAKVRFGKINTTLIEETISFPWSGESFSDIIWNNTDKLARELKSELVQGFIKGTSVQKMSMNLAKRMDSSFKNAQRVVITESAHILNKASLMSYAAVGVKQVEFLAVLDGRTSSLCFSLNGDIIDIEDAVPGKNIPPLHPHCRSTIVPVVDDSVDFTENSGRIEVGTKLNEHEVVIENPKQKITGISKHAGKQITGRNITTSDAQSYIDNSLTAILQNKTKTIKYLSDQGTSIVNAKGILVTAYSSNDFDESELELLRKLRR